MAQVLKRIKVVTFGKFADEEAGTEYGLPNQWAGAKSVDEQVGILPDLLKTNPNAETKKFLQEGLPRWFDLEWPEWIDGFFTCLNPLVDYRSQLFGKIIPALAKKVAERNWSFTNYRVGQLGDDLLRLNAQTMAAYKEMAEVQKGNFWVMPMSLANGKRYPGKTCSPRRYLELCGQREFGIGPSAGLCAVLTHFDERVQLGKVLRLDFPGVKYDHHDHHDASERYSFVPCLEWEDGGWASLGIAHPAGCSSGFASVLGLLPQQ